MKSPVGMLIAATLVVGFGCAKQDWIDRTLVTIDVTGTWQEYSAGQAPFRLELEQQGSKVKGFVRLQMAPGMGENPTGPLEGTVAGDVFHFSKRGVEMELTVNGDEMHGLLRTMFSNRQIAFRRVVDPSSPPASPPK